MLLKTIENRNRTRVFDQITHDYYRCRKSGKAWVMEFKWPTKSRSIRASLQADIHVGQSITQVKKSEQKPAI